jgi:sugar/nucleoside kinase (ribokinase family)
VVSGGSPDVTIVGNVNLDVLVRDVRSLPAPGEERFVEAAELRTGGAAANAALALAALDVPVRLVGGVGDDPAGRLIRDDLAAHGLDLAGVRSLRGVPTGVSVALEAPDRDRSFLTAAGALAAFDRAMVPPDALDAAYVLVTGTFLLPGLGHEGTAALLRDAKERRATVLFDPGSDPAGWSEANVRAIRSSLELVDVFLPNEQEALGLAREPDPLTAARSLQAAETWVVVKRGSRGAVAAGPGGQTAEVDATPVEVVDTTGAGDAFDAGVIAGMMHGATFPDAIALASRFASAVVARPSADRYPGREMFG